MGLGNPGPRYARTRHNVGFEIALAWAARHAIPVTTRRFDSLVGSGGVAGRDVTVMLPQTFMNASGDAVGAALAVMGGLDPARDLLVVYDDIDLPTGRIRLRATGGAGGHRGMASVIRAVGREEIPRLRFGVGRPPPERPAREYVLEPLEGSEEERIARGAVVAGDAIETFVVSGIVAAMDRFNGSPPAAEPV